MSENCPNCQKNVSPQAEACPNCGHPIKPAKKSSGCAIIFLLSLVVVGNMFYQATTPKTPEEQEIDKLRDYKYTAQVHVRTMLRSPGTADFPLEALVYKQDGLYIVESYVDAQNGFGALIRNYYAVAIDQRSDGRYIIDSKISEYPITAASLELSGFESTPETDVSLPVTIEQTEVQQPVTIEQTEVQRPLDDGFLTLSRQDGTQVLLKPIFHNAGFLRVEMPIGENVTTKLEEFSQGSQELILEKLGETVPTP